MKGTDLSMSDFVLIDATSDGLRFCGVPVLTGPDSGLLEWISEAAVSGRPELLVTPNVDQLINLSEDPDFRAAYELASIAILDGMPLVLLARTLGVSGARRSTGADLIFSAAELAAQRQLRVAITGGAAGVSAAAATNLNRRSGADIRAVDFPHITDVGDPRSGQVIESLRAMDPDIVFLCLGSPKQERWYQRWCAELPPALYVGAGGAVDFAAGTVRRAPVVVQRVGLEWLWRLAQEPRRLVHRYLIKGPRFIGLVARSFTRADGS